jgi:DNA-binding CsgD family transcriptional regulator
VGAKFQSDGGDAIALKRKHFVAVRIFVSATDICMKPSSIELAKLSIGQLHLLLLLGRGMTSKEIARAQARKPSAVDASIETLKHLFQVNSRTALLMAAISQGVLEVTSSEPNISEEIFRVLGKERPPADSSYCE